MEDLIRRSDAIDVISLWFKKIELNPDILIDGIKTLPSADRPQGEWIQNENGTFSCSECRSWIPKEQRLYARYCLYCGTPMKCAGDMRRSGMYIVTHPMY